MKIIICVCTGVCLRSDSL